MYFFRYAYILLIISGVIFLSTESKDYDEFLTLIILFPVSFLGVYGVLIPLILFIVFVYSLFSVLIPKKFFESFKQIPVDIVLVSKKLRFANFVIDFIICFIIVQIISAILIGLVIFDFNGIDESKMWLLYYIILVVPLTYVIYYIIFESLTGRTLGKLMTKTKVVNKDGQRASFGQILARSLLRLIPLEQIMFLGKTGCGLHDIFANTFVVKNQ